MSDLSINLLASVIAGTAGWLAQRLIRYRRMAREQAADVSCSAFTAPG